MSDVKKLTPEEFERWLEMDPKPDRVWSTRDKTNWHVIRHRTSLELLTDCIDAAKQESGEKSFVLEVKGDWGAITHLIQYTVSNVHIVPVCSDGHDFTDWQYDFTGGDLRKCKVCGLTEHV
jgi:hypothetical protein